MAPKLGRTNDSRAPNNTRHLCELESAARDGHTATLAKYEIHEICSSASRQDLSTHRGEHAQYDGHAPALNPDRGPVPRAADEAGEGESNSRCRPNAGRHTRRRTTSRPPASAGSWTKHTPRAEPMPTRQNTVSPGSTTAIWRTPTSQPHAQADGPRRTLAAPRARLCQVFIMHDWGLLLSRISAGRERAERRARRRR